MCKTCKHYDVVCCGTSHARGWRRLSGDYVKDGQAPCEKYKEKTAPAGTGRGTSSMTVN